MKVIDVWYSSIVSSQNSYIVDNLVIYDSQVHPYLQWADRCCVCGPFAKLTQTHTPIDRLI